MGVLPLGYVGTVNFLGGMGDEANKINQSPQLTHCKPPHYLQYTIAKLSHRP